MKHARKLTAAIGIAAALLTITWWSGRTAGIRHTIEDAELCIVDFDESEGGEYDLTIYIDLDGNTYTHGCYIG